MRKLTFEGDVLRNDLATKGYTLVDHKISEDQIDNLIGSYADFTDNLPDPSPEVLDKMLPQTADPEKLKNELDDVDHTKDTSSEWHKYRTNFPFFAKPQGYTNRSLTTRTIREQRGHDIKDDPKEFFHYAPGFLQTLKMRHEEFGWGPLPPELITLDREFLGIHNAARLAMHKTFQLVEETHPDLIQNFVTPDDLQNSPLRLLFYHPGQGEQLAGGHVDKSTGTIQIAESHVGLRLLDPTLAHQKWDGPQVDDPRMKIVRRASNHGAYFSGFNLKSHFPETDQVAAWHDVVNHPEFNAGRSLRGQNVARWALIFFANSLSTKLPTKEQTHAEASAA